MTRSCSKPPRQVRCEGREKLSKLRGDYEAKERKLPTDTQLVQLIDVQAHEVGRAAAMAAFGCRPGEVPSQLHETAPPIACRSQKKKLPGERNLPPARMDRPGPFMRWRSNRAARGSTVTSQRVRLV